MQATLLETTKRTASRKGLYALTAAFAVIGVCVGVFAAMQYQHVQSTQLVYTVGDLNPTAIFDLYSHWKQAYGKLYGTEEESQARFGIFQNNYLFIINYNNDNTKTATMSLNEYADLTTAEFGALKSCLNISAKTTSTNTVLLSTVGLPDSVDWRSTAVTPIKNQGQCGSCWSFSTTGSLEGLNAITNGNLLSFSEQQLVDCSQSYGNNGCNGGLMDDAFQYVISQGIEQESTYPYTAETGTCQYVQASTVFANTGYTDVTPQNPSQLQAAVAQQPISIAVEAD
jgi:hypothetical protein